MTIISRDASTAGTPCAVSPGQRSVTRPGTAPRVGPAATASHGPSAHSIGRMDQPELDLPAVPAPTPAADDRPWVYERVLGLVVEGRVWADNQRRRWLYDGGETTGERMPTQDQAVLATLQQLGHVRVVHAKVAMDLNDGRTLRVRRYEPTPSGAELYAQWARLSPYTA